MVRLLYLAVIGTLLRLCNGQCPLVPLNPRGQPVSVPDTMGLWYEYRFRNGPAATDQSGTNVRINQTILAMFPTQPASYVVTRWYNFLVQDNPTDPVTCDAIVQQGNWTSDGRRQVLSAGAGAPITNVTYINLFTDYNLLQILYRCETPNPDGQHCDQPFMWINTRIQPPLLSDCQKAYIQNMVNFYLADICRGFNDTSATEWNMALTLPCNVAQGTPPLPADFAATLPQNIAVVG
ncbi:uncharacterized protein LOC129592831 [Paramacrobiotus metropolitanus]|uniref:uncharacterized protein LOC129592831 n=1 Tax=Paramacrobiotus metropolitanus TaxID=2943436 RepID=UPI0024462BF0|nr:uncharacterized protein LOC129592831 [Paramacrobiotus metropolitanus]